MIALTKLLKILDKPALLKWANKIGLQGVSLDDYMNKSSKKGISIHNDIENYLINNVKFEYSDKIDKCLNGYNIIAIEKSFDNGYISCRADMLLEKEGKKIVVDFKSNNKIYLQQKLQLSTYKEMLLYDEIAIINFDKWQLEFININTKQYFEIVKNLYKINSLLTQLNEKL